MPRKPAGQRLETRLIHKKDVELFDRLKANPAFEPLGDAELVRVALRELDKQNAFSEMLVNFEKRMAGSMKALHKRIDQLDNQNQMLMAFFEVFMRTYYFHTLPVPATARATAVADAERRSKKFIEDVASLLDKGGAASEIIVQLNSLNEGMDNV